MKVFLLENQSDDNDFSELLKKKAETSGHFSVDGYPHSPKNLIYVN